MKKFSLILTLIVLITIFSGCQSKQQDFSFLIDTCSAKAQEYIDAKDYSSAIAVLEEGLAATNNAKELLEMLEVVQTMINPTEDIASTVCPKCSTASASKAKFCIECGTELTNNLSISTISLEQFIGKWADSVSMRCNLEITVSNDNSAFIQIIWPNSATERTKWEMHGTIDASTGNLIFTDCRKFTEIYPGNGSPTTNIEYENGSGYFSFADDHLYWTDNTEEAGAECIFEQIPQADTNRSSAFQKYVATSHSADDIAYLNSFLSIFASQQFGASGGLFTDQDLLSFAYLYCMLHEPESIHWDTEGYPTEYAQEVLPAACIDTVLQHFFNRTITHPTFEQWVIENWAYYDATNSNYRFVCTDGGYYGYIAIIDSISQNQEGFYEVLFTIYEVNSDIYYGNEEAVNSYFYLTAEEAAQNEDLSYFLSGMATLGHRTLADDPMDYYVHSYQTWILNARPDVYTYEELQPVYDTSKASGILANLGMTEEEFKARCTYIGSRYNNYKNEYAYSMGRNYYAENPQDDQPEKYAEYWQDYLINGKRSVHYTIERAESFNLAKDLENFLDIAVYGPKGASILGDNSEAIVDGMCEHPDNYIGNAYLLKDFTVDNFYNYVYSCDWFLGTSIPFTIYDYRDNVTSPTVSGNSNYDMYVIFLGNYMDYNEVGLEFALISLEKCE